jgi:predicted DNA-binding transcriptional regulator YafY
MARHADGVPLGELAEMLGVKPAVLRSELTRLVTVGLPEGDRGDYLDTSRRRAGASGAGVRHGPILAPAPALTTSNAFALVLGASNLRKTGIESFDDALARAEGKIRSIMAAAPDGALGQVSADAGRGPSGPLRDLARASQARRAVELDYASVAGQKRKMFVVEPYGLAVAHHAQTGRPSTVTQPAVPTRA